MRIAIIAAAYPPSSHGGAEDCAQSFAQWAATQGHEVVVIAAGTAIDHAELIEASGVSVWRIHTPHIYPLTQFQSALGWQKPIWHLQDHMIRAQEKPFGRGWSASGPRS